MIIEKNPTRVYDDEGFILKAGGVIVEGDKILLIYRKKTDDYSFPKGHIEIGEKAEETLIREVKEETGLDIKILKPLTDIIYEYPEGDGKVRVKMFLTSLAGGKLTGEFDGDELLWAPINEVSEKLSYGNNRDFFENNLETIKNA
jgi:8-oxo-dGTP diphosphatase